VQPGCVTRQLCSKATSRGKAGSTVGTGDDHAIIWTMFPVEIWGNVAEWAGAIGTGGAAMAAAGFYIYDRYRESTAQSRQVNFVDYGTVYEVTNASDQPIHYVSLLYDPPKTFGAALAG